MTVRLGHKTRCVGTAVQDTTVLRGEDTAVEGDRHHHHHLLVGGDTVEEGAGKATTEASWSGTFPSIVDLRNFESPSNVSVPSVMSTFQRTITQGDLSHYIIISNKS